MKITVAHSPDADDAFLFYALARSKISTGDLEFVHTLLDIQACNDAALKEVYDVTAFSFAAYPFISPHYVLADSGASVGEKDYGPILAAPKKFAPAEIPGLRIAIPGEKTTATLLLKLAFPEAKNTKVFPFDKIIGAVKSGEAQAGLLIHEGQLTFAEAGLVEIFNFGRWWWNQEHLPLPLGGNGIRRAFEPSLKMKIASLLKESIQYALDHFEEALAYALPFASNLNREKTAQFVRMYVNERTLSYGEEGRRAVRRLLERAAQKGLLPSVEPEFLI